MSNTYSPEAYVELNDTLSEILIITQQIEERVKELGRSISLPYY
jgi:hypothetical protein